MIRCYLDVETTGQPRWERPADHKDQPWLVSITALLCDDKEPIDGPWYWIIKPEGWTIPPSATKVHNITTERAQAEGVPLVFAMTEFGKMHDAVLSGEIIAWAINFDMKVLRGAYRRASLFERQGFGELVDAKQLAARAMGGNVTWAGAMKNLASYEHPKNLDPVRDLLALKAMVEAIDG